VNYGAAGLAAPAGLAASAGLAAIAALSAGAAAEAAASGAGAVSSDLLHAVAKTSKLVLEAGPCASLSPWLLVLS